MLQVSFFASRRVDVLDANVLSVPGVNHHIPRVAVQTIRPVVEALRRECTAKQLTWFYFS